MGSTPSKVSVMVNQWRYLDPQSCDSYERALTLAENWLYSRLGS